LTELGEKREAALKAFEEAKEQWATAQTKAGEQELGKVEAEKSLEKARRELLLKQSNLEAHNKMVLQPTAAKVEADAAARKSWEERQKQQQEGLSQKVNKNRLSTSQKQLLLEAQMVETWFQRYAKHLKAYEEAKTEVEKLTKQVEEAKANVHQAKEELKAVSKISDQAKNTMSPLTDAMNKASAKLEDLKAEEEKQRKALNSKVTQLHDALHKSAKEAKRSYELHKITFERAKRALRRDKLDASEASTSYEEAAHELEPSSQQLVKDTKKAAADAQNFYSASKKAAEEAKQKMQEDYDRLEQQVTALRKLHDAFPFTRIK
jgi:hypothetical protein